MAELLDGKKVSHGWMEALAQEIQSLSPGVLLPKLVVLLVGEDPASQVYVKKKAQMAHRLGILSEVHTYDSRISQEELSREIIRLNEDPSVHAILVQLPLPKHIHSLDILTLVSPHKDVDGFHPLNLGKLMMGQLPTALPCTPAGMMKLLEAYHIPLSGKHAVVVGRSNIVGKPVGMLLLQQNATVTYCHSRTRDLPAITRMADILIAAVGVPELITADHVSPGVVVLDVGINRTENGLVGDVAFPEVAEKAAYITPVPGGVGPMTIATLMSNTIALYREALSQP